MDMNIEKLLAPPLLVREKGAPGGVATLDAMGSLSTVQRPVSYVSRRIYAPFPQGVTSALSQPPDPFPLVSHGMDLARNALYLEVASPDDTPLEATLVVQLHVMIDTPPNFLGWDDLLHAFVAVGGGVQGDASVSYLPENDDPEVLSIDGTHLSLSPIGSVAGRGILLTFEMRCQGPNSACRMYHIDQNYHAG